MSLKVRFKFDGKCPTHPRYNPAKDGNTVAQLHGMQPCAGCDDLWVIYLYTKIANKRAEHITTVKTGYNYNFSDHPVTCGKPVDKVEEPSVTKPEKKKRRRHNITGQSKEDTNE